MKESLLTGLFLQGGLFLFLAAIIIPVLKYCRVPTALGYLLAGIALGPFGLGAIEQFTPVSEFIGLDNTEHVKVLAELGIVLLLFIIGLELTPQRLWQMRNLVFGLGGTQVLLSALVIGAIAYGWGNDIKVSILLGLSLALSSTAMILQWLQEKQLFATDVGRTSFSILLFQDIAVIPILLLLTLLSADTDQGIAHFVGVSLFKMALTIAAIFLVGKIILKPLFVFSNRHGGAEVFIALSLLIIVASATVADMAGLSMALGAFIAGLLIADTEYRHEVEGLILPFKSMLIGIFFVSFGMGINLQFFSEKPFWILASVIGLMGIKAVIIFTLCKIWKQKTAVAAESGIILSQAGEFGLLVVGSALAVGLMQQDVGQFMLIVIGTSMIITPLITPLARKVGAYLESKTQNTKDYEASNAEEIEGHIVIFGYGRVGQQVAESVCKAGMSYIAFDKEIEKVSGAQSKTAPVFLGSVMKKSTVKAAQIDKALCVVVTIDNANTTRKIVQKIRENCKTTPIVVRGRTLEDVKSFDDYAYVDAVAENVLVSSKIMEEVLLNIGYHDIEEEAA
ncbi:MAG: cation:proton antiporter [Pseudomonadota bacterium]